MAGDARRKGNFEGFSGNIRPGDWTGVSHAFEHLIRDVDC